MKTLLIAVAFALALLVTVAMAAQAGPPASPQSVPQADTFANWLNGTRARYGLRGVAYDQALTNDAARNSQIQSARGLGHYWMGSARRQDSGQGSLAGCMVAWLRSPPHLAAIIDPRVTRYGLAGSGIYWTLNLR